MQTILFVCTGNTCRSPMAEAIARQWLREGGLGGLERNFIASAGVATSGESAITKETINALRGLGIDHHGRSKPLSREMVQKADLVLCMTDEHIEAVRELIDNDPEQMKKVTRVDPEGDIDDPVGRGQKTYDELAKRFKRVIPQRLEELLGHEDRTRIGSSR